MLRFGKTETWLETCSQRGGHGLRRFASPAGSASVKTKGICVFRVKQDQSAFMQLRLREILTTAKVSLLQS